MTDEFAATYWPEVERIASAEWKRSTIYEREDIEQAIWEHVTSNWKHYAEAGEANISKWMTRAAREYARKERIAYMYSTGSFTYTPALVAAYLETCAWEPLEEVPDVDARVDLREAFALLSKSAPAQASAVFKRYGMKESGLSEAEQKNVLRGVDSLTHRLNTGLRLQAESIDSAIAQEA